MGIHCLTKLIQLKSPTSIKHGSLYQFKDKKIAIDTSIFLYKSLMNVRSHGEYLRNSEGKVISHIIGLFNKIVLLKFYGIIPIFIFDGKPPDEKRNVLDERNKKAKESKEKMNETTNVTEIQELEKKTIRITKEHIEDLKLLFSKMGVSYIHANGEAEAYAAELCRIDYVQAVMSEDMDTLVFGCPTFIRSSIEKGKKRSDSISVFSLEQILKDFNMTMKEFTDLCILCGCDYCSTINKVGHNRAYSYIQNYKTIETLIETNKCDITDEFKERFSRARDLFSIYFNKIQIDTLPIQSFNYSESELYNYMTQYCNMNEKRVQTALKKIKPIV